MPYRDWKYPADEKVNPKAVIPIGAWGVLYPAKSLHPEVLVSRVAAFDDAPEALFDPAPKIVFRRPLDQLD